MYRFGCGCFLPKQLIKTKCQNTGAFLVFSHSSLLCIDFFLSFLRKIACLLTRDILWFLVTSIIVEVIVVVNYSKL